MRVIHLACVAPPQTGGIGAAAYHEVQLLNARGVDAVLLSPRSDKVQGVAGQYIQRFPTVWNYGNTAIPNPFALERMLRGADIVHLHYPFYGTSEFVTLYKWLRCVKKVVVTLHMDALRPGVHGAVLNFHRFLFQPFELRAADALIVSSTDYAAHSSFAPWADKVIELPFGVDEDVFHPSGDRTPSKHILFVGGMDTAHAFKGVDVLLEALVRLPADVHATLVGDGNLRPSFEAHAKALGLGSRVTFTGKLSTERLAEAYRSADVFAFPSTSGAEAFGLVALEAQASGVPVIASDLPGVRTVVTNGESGFLVPPCNAVALAERLSYVLDHPDLAKNMGEQARARVLRTFTWEKHLDGLRAVYERLCASPS